MTEALENSWTSAVRQPSLTMVNGDFRDQLKIWVPDESVDLVFLDFPYGESDKASGKNTFQGKEVALSNINVDWDYSREETIVLMRQAFREAWRVLKPRGWMVLTATPYAKYVVYYLLNTLTTEKFKGPFISNDPLAVPPFRFINEVIWCKPNANPGSYTAPLKKVIQSQESVFLYSKGFPETFNYEWLKYHKTKYERALLSKPDAVVQARDFWIINVDTQNRLHPTQKPETLLHRIMGGWTNPGQTVLDFFGGSGTSGVCLLHGCDYIYVEREETYFNLASKRLLDWKEMWKNGYNYREAIFKIGKTEEKVG